MVRDREFVDLSMLAQQFAVARRQDRAVEDVVAVVFRPSGDHPDAVLFGRGRKLRAALARNGLRERARFRPGPREVETFRWDNGIASGIRGPAHHRHRTLQVPAAAPPSTSNCPFRPS